MYFDITTPNPAHIPSPVLHDAPRSRTDIECHDNPYDIRKPANRIVDHFMSRANKGGSSNRGHVLLMGENHAHPLHTLLLMGVLETLTRQGIRPALAIELPYNYYDTIAANLYGYYLDNDTANYLARHDRDKANLLHGSIAYSRRFSCSPVAHGHFLSYVHQRNFAFAFADLPFDKNVWLRPWDHYTKPLIEELDIKDRSDSIVVHEPVGIKLRNRALFNAATHLYAESGADVLIVQTGNLHVHGMEERGWDYKDSLGALFHKAGWQTTASVPTIDDKPFTQFFQGDTVFTHGLSPCAMIAEKFILPDAIRESGDILQTHKLDSQISLSSRIFKKFVKSTLRERACAGQGFFRRLLPI